MRTSPGSHMNVSCSRLSKSKQTANTGLTRGANGAEGASISARRHRFAGCILQMSVLD